MSTLEIALWLLVVVQTIRAAQEIRAQISADRRGARMLTMAQSSVSRADAILHATNIPIPKDPPVIETADVLDGRYTIRQCGDHWHVVDPSNVIVGGAYQEPSAAIEIANMLNAKRFET